MELRTVDFGTIRIVDKVNMHYDTFIGFDCIGEWEFWQLADGEIVALESVD